MILILISWVIIFLILFSFGSIFIDIFNKFSRSNESYNLLDIFILGICFISIVLPITSFWFPSNQYILLICFILSFAYWTFNRKKLKDYFNCIKSTIKSIKIYEVVFLVVAIIGVFIGLLYMPHNYDSVCYQHQQIRWNEEYPVIPGLANLEDRFGFNSNYLLLSALFSFRFLFGEAIYSLHSLLFMLIFCWILVRVFKTRYNIRYLVLFFLFFLFYTLHKLHFADSNTDLIPSLCIFYYIAKTVLYPNWLTKQTLLAFFLPVMLLTFKISCGLICLMSLFVLYNLIITRKYRTIIFLLTISLIIVGVWCVRNVIMTGYLIYPLSVIDLFSFDWKIPQCTAHLQQTHIYYWAKYIHDVRYVEFILQNGIRAYKPLINYGMFLLSCISILFVVYCMIKKKNINKNIYIIYFVSYLNLIFGMVNAPDFRFSNGCIFGIFFISIVLLLSSFNIDKRRFVNSGKIFISFILVLFVIDILYSWIMAYKKDFEMNSGSGQFSFFLCPVTPITQVGYAKYNMNGLTIYLTRDSRFRTFDMLPSTDSEGLPFRPFTGHKLQNIKTIEARGTRLKNGFRTKKEYVDLLNKNTELCRQEYLELRKRRKDLD